MHFVAKFDEILPKMCISSSSTRISSSNQKRVARKIFT